jgi:hypothetical protein
VAYEAEVNAKGERLIWLERVWGRQARRDARSRGELQRRDPEAGEANVELEERSATRPAVA